MYYHSKLTCTSLHITTSGFCHPKAEFRPAPRIADTAERSEKKNVTVTSQLQK